MVFEAAAAINPSSSLQNDFDAPFVDDTDPQPRAVTSFATPRLRQH
jgi:hypothetical protein